MAHKADTKGEMGYSPEMMGRRPTPDDWGEIPEGKLFELCSLSGTPLAAPPEQHERPRKRPDLRLVQKPAA